MFYKLYQPQTSLRPYIDYFFLLECRASAQAPFDLPSTAHPHHGLVFNYGDRYRLSNLVYDRELLPSSFLSGLNTGSYRLHFTGEVAMLGVVFRTTAFRHLLRLSPCELHELQDRRADATIWLGSRADAFCEQLAGAPSREGRIQLANQLFTELFAKKQLLPHLAERAVDHIINRHGMLAMDELAQALYVSPRHLRRVFNEEVGVGPKYFARLKRFNYVYRGLIHYGEQWQQYVGEKGFYDQSHFIRDIQAFTGRPPSKLLLDRMESAQSG